MNVLFNSGDEVIFMGLPKGNTWNPEHPVLTEGKKYHIKNPCAEDSNNVIWVTLHQFGDDLGWNQLGFIKADEDLQLEKEISNALNENLKIKI